MDPSCILCYITLEDWSRSVISNISPEGQRPKGDIFFILTETKSRLIWMYIQREYEKILVLRCPKVLKNHPRWWYPKIYHTRAARPKCDIFLDIITEDDFLTPRDIFASKCSSVRVVYTLIWHLRDQSYNVILDIYNKGSCIMPFWSNFSVSNDMLILSLFHYL